MTTALFLGRFQPPHVGHLLTIRSLANAYEELIVGVTEAAPSVMPVHNVIELLEILLPEPNIRFLYVPGSVEGGTAEIKADFDVCCSGNQAVLDIMQGKGYQTRYTPRSNDHIYSGTRERQAFMSSALQSSQIATPELTEFKLVNTLALRPIEKVNPRHFSVIEADILQSGILQKPLIVDRLTLSVLDGSHRYAFLLKHGFEQAPAILCDYDDESIFVGTHLQHRFEHDDKKWITKQHVRATALSGEPYNPRTTRHFFPFRKQDLPTDIKTLNQGPARDIKHLLHNTSPEDEVANNNTYIQELDHELQSLQDYMEEQREVQNWLARQNAEILSRHD